MRSHSTGHLNWGMASRFLLLTISRRGVSFHLILRRKASMGDKSGDLVQGTLDMLILKTLALEPMHGYGIAVRLEQMSKGVFRLNAGSLFVAFQRLQRDGLIRSEWKATENSRRAKYYALTEQGRKRLNSETREWGRQVAAIARILERSEEHTSELQSQSNLVCRLLLEKKKKRHRTEKLMKDNYYSASDINVVVTSNAILEAVVT